MQLMQSYAANCYLLSVVGLVARLKYQPVAGSQGVVFQDKAGNLQTQTNQKQKYALQAKTTALYRLL